LENGSGFRQGNFLADNRNTGLGAFLIKKIVIQRSDEELYKLMKGGDRDAFGELYERRGPALRRYALHMSGSPSAAEEVAHEVFVQLMRANTNFDDKRGSLEGWMYGVARNLVRVIRRKGPVQEPVDQAFRHDILEI